MFELKGSNVVVLDIETKRSADSCLFCDCPQQGHQSVGHFFEKIGWENKLALGLSIGCLFSYRDMSLHWFDEFTLEDTVRLWVTERPLIVSFNGVSFDAAVLRAILRHREPSLGHLCDDFKALCATSYDLLQEIWKIDPQNKFVRGLNSLDALCRANGLPLKEMDGALAPRLWAQGRYAEVIAYNVQDVLRTKALFEMVCAGQPLLRGDGLPITLPLPPGLSTVGRHGAERQEGTASQTPTQGDTL